ncbi:hypothetical protein SOV_40340 [Sporomusa ovata DSM 2662]|uniref:Uncharacterized protein n=1 Tax=Sporomusa ovata TaxID=2378 RepID=A0A0U1KSV2_9FIRM|nr:hypothetical protein SOV_3c02950 [Sporomusa ovata DSM 2662]CQR70502.1 hypothetical protein SpAn4DRAFT_1471 [Sporomusa ovata]
MVLGDFGMLRSARQLSKPEFYHLMLRGNERRDIFLDDADKLTFIDFCMQRNLMKVACYMPIV